MKPAAAPRPDWSRIDTVLTDMDGTLLDLSFDNRFWLEQVPASFAAARNLSLAAARAQLEPLFAAKQGTLEWYCIDYWSRELALDIAALKHEAREDIRWLAEAEVFLRALRRQGKRVALVTNAHPGTLAVKRDRLDFEGHFDAVYSSHPFGVPKENPQFWSRLAAVERFDPRRTLFVDDSLAVLRAARGHGIEWIYAIARPDSTQPRRTVEEFPAVDSVAELL